MRANVPLSDHAAEEIRRAGLQPAEGEEGQIRCRGEMVFLL